MAKRKRRKGGKKKKHGGHIPITILKRRLAKLSKVVKSRGG